jgi:Tol biopolymer transport system component
VTGATRRVSVSTTGGQGNSHSRNVAISANGRIVAFMSEASNLAPGDSNGQADVFVHHLSTGVTERVSVATGGEEANGLSDLPALSADGRVVVFWSSATNLVPGDTNQWGDIFRHDLETGVTERVSVATGGGQANRGSDWPSVSGDGTLVAFESSARNLVLGDTNRVADAFVHDRSTGVTTRVDVSSQGDQANCYLVFEECWGGGHHPSISGDGRLVGFDSYSDNLVPGDTNDASDVFVHDLVTGRTGRISVTWEGRQANGFSAEPSLSGDGRVIAYYSSASNLVPDDTNGEFDIFVFDLR